MSVLKASLVYGGLTIILVEKLQTLILGFNLVPQYLTATTLPYLAAGIVVLGAYQVE